MSFWCIFLYVTERKWEVVTHAQELSEADESVLGVDPAVLHLLDGVPHGVGVVAGHHDADPLLAAVAPLLQLGHPAKALGQTAVVHVGGGLVRGVDGVVVAQLAGSLAFLPFHKKKFKKDLSF